MMNANLNQAEAVSCITPVYGSVVSSDGSQVRYHYHLAGEEQPWIVLIMPFGLRSEMTQPFMQFFGRHYNIVSWESRLILDDGSEGFAPEHYQVRLHVADLLKVMDACAIKRAFLVGYCSGAGIALAALNRAPQLFRSVCLVHGEYTLLQNKPCMTQFALDIDSLLGLAAGSERGANMVFEKLQSERMDSSQHLPDGLDVPYSDIRFFRRYSNNYLSYKAEDYENLARQVSHKTLLLSGEKDIQANVTSTLHMADLLENSTVFIDPQADHYGMIRYGSRTMINVWNFLSVEQAAAQG